MGLQTIVAKRAKTFFCVGTLLNQRKLIKLYQMYFIYLSATPSETNNKVVGTKNNLNLLLKSFAFDNKCQERYGELRYVGIY